MTSTRLLDLLRLLLRQPLHLLGAGIAWLLDRGRHLDSLRAGLLALLLLAIAGGLAWALQRRWTGRLAEAAREGGRPAALGTGEIVRLELSHSPLFLPFKPFQLLGRGLRALGRGMAGLLRRLFRRGAGSRGDEAAPAARPPLLVASLGPSFFAAGLVTAGLYLLLRLLDPLLAGELGLARGLSAWQYFLFGRRHPELAWLLPLDRYPYFGSLLAVAFWVPLWWLAGALLRLARASTLGRDLHPLRRDPAVLRGWRRWAGAPELWRTADSYRRWALWPVALAAPLLAWGWLHLGGDPYRIAPAELAVALVLWLSWLLLVVLRGTCREAAGAAAEEAPEPERPHGWEDVLAYLEAEHRVARPEPFPAVAAAEPAPSPAEAATLLSPLVLELLERSVSEVGAGEGEGRAVEPPRPTRMQHEVLTVLALQGFVHTDPPVALDQLRLGGPETAVLEDRSGQRSRNQVVLAPESWGKTTLALLAVANHALLHTRASLVVTSGERRATELHARFRRAVDPSTLRWNLRVRELGPELMNDLSRGIVPDVVVTALGDLVTTLLDRTATFAPYLRNLGLIVIDDVESFAGAVEVHAQLAFRRLVLRVEELVGAEELGGADLAGPQILILGSDTMNETSEWAQSLCGVEAVTRRFGTPEEARQEPPPARHLVYRLRDFRTPDGEALGLADLVAACEAVEVPWCYRPCGDGRRDLGRGPLLLPEEPRGATERPEEACVLLLEGSWSGVERERARLLRAGTRFARRRRGGSGDSSVDGDGAGVPEPVALVTVVEPDLETAFTQLDQRFALTPTLASLPRPVIRPPTGLAVLPHLSAELTQHWLEVAEAVRVFGAPVAGVLRHLAGDGLLLTEERRDVAAKANEYVRRVHVQALARAVASDRGRPGVDDGALPPKVSQVTLVSSHAVAVRDRTSLVTLSETDAASAHVVFYPGRIFADARGTFVVVEHLAEESGPGSVEGPPGDVLVEPILTDSISSPRRRVSAQVLDEREREADGGQLVQAAGGAFVAAGPTLLGRYPLEIALQPVRVAVEHLATFRLGPAHCEVRQRSVLDPRVRERLAGRRFDTVGLIIRPHLTPREETDDTPGPGEPGDSGPALTLGSARLLAAAMRLVIPSLVRGGEDALGVALHLAPGRTGDDEELGRGEGFVLFDADAGGNGAARAVYRDGIDLLLRLCRLVIERVLSLDRLRTIHDEWATLERVLAEGHRELGGEDVEALAGERRARDREARRELLAWLDGRLRPEGGTEAQRDLERWFGSGREPGEGDVMDLGRCWVSADGAVTDLLWAKHRWHRAGGGEALLDVGFDRTTLAAARALAAGGGDRLEAYGRALDRARSAAGEGERPAPRAVCHGGGLGSPPDGRSEELFRHLWALAADAGEAVGPLAAQLADAPAATRSVSTAAALCRFVQGIPTGGGSGERDAAGAGGDLLAPAPPVETLLRREGGPLDKALLLASLLARAGQPAGCFVSFADGRAVGAVPEEGGAGAGTSVEPPFWAEAGGAGGPRLVPVALDRALEPGWIETRDPAAWLFFPLRDLPSGLSPEPNRSRSGEISAAVGTDDAGGGHA